MEQDTIAAISTAVSNSGIGIIRISGKDAVAVADRVYRSGGGKKRLADQPTHTIHYGYIVDQGETVDRGTCDADAWSEELHRGGHSGGELPWRCLRDEAGAGCSTEKWRAPAEPGEFTKRAF